MTNKKRLLSLGVIVTILLAVLIFIPKDGSKNQSLGSDTFNDKRCTYETKTFTQAQIANKIDDIRKDLKPSSKNVFVIHGDDTTAEKVCQKFGYDSTNGYETKRFDPIKNHVTFKWNITEQRFRYIEDNPYITSLGCIKTPVTCNSPKTPTGVTLTAGVKKIILSWIASDSNGGTVITDYIVECRKKGINTWTSYPNANDTTTTRTITGLDGNTVYECRVSAKNKNNYTSDPSAIKTVTTLVSTMYTVGFDARGGSPTGSARDDIPKNGTIGTLPTQPTKTNFDFGGWYTAVNGGGKQFTDSTPVNATITVYAKWTAKTYTVTFDSQGATTDASPTTKTVLVPATKINSLPSNPTKTGKDFGGWYTAVNGGGTQFTATTTVSGNITVYAKWTAKTYTITIPTVTNGTITRANASPVIDVIHGTTTTFTVTPSAGYKAEVSGCGGTLAGKVYTTGAITEDCTLSVVFSLNSAPSCTGVRPANSVVHQNIESSETSLAWTHDASPTGPYQFCSFKCNNDTTYSDASKTCIDTTVTLTSIANITGTAKVGQTLTAGAVLPTGSQVSYQWKSSSTVGGTYNDITSGGANSSTYLLKTSDLNQYIKVEVTGTGTHTGTKLSNASNQIAAADDTSTPPTPSAPGVSGGTTDGAPTITVQCTRADSTITFYNSNSILYTYTCTQTGSRTFTLSPALTTGVYSLSYTETYPNTNVSGKSPSYSLTVTRGDTTPPTVTAFSIPPTASSLTINSISITASESGVSYLITENSTKPLGSNLGWSSTAPIGYVFSSAGDKTLYAWVKDSAGNVSDFRSATTVVTLTNTATSVVRVTSSRANGVYRAGTIIPISIEFLQPVIVTGIPTLKLETGVNDVTIPFKQMESDNKTLTFEYAVGDGDTSSDLNYVGIDSLMLADASITIKDAATGVVVNRTLPALTSSGSLATNKDIVIDTTRPAAPAAPIVPQQTTIVNSTSDAQTFIASGNNMVMNVACTTGEKVRIYNSVSFVPLKTVDCVNNLVTYTADFISQESYYNYFATITDTAGNESDYSPRIVVLKKQTATNNAGTLVMDALSDLGKSSTDNFTSETRPKFTVTCTSGSVVNLYEGANLLATSSCMANIAQLIPIQPLSHGVHILTTKQILNNSVSAISSPLTVTIDTTPLTVALARANTQTEPANSSTIQFTATFSRPIDPVSFVCSDITVLNGECQTIAAVSTTVYTITIIATTQGTVKATIYAGRVQTDAGNTNTESTGVNTVTYGTATNTTNAKCSTLRRFSDSRPNSSSLNNQTLCEKGTASTVAYNTRTLKWTYQCRGTDGTSDSCTVAALLNSAGTCNLKPVDVVSFDSCTPLRGNNLFNSYQYLTCLDIVPEKKSCADALCTTNAPRQELVRIAGRIRGIPLDDNYECQDTFSDTNRGTASWVCEAVEKAEIAGLITGDNDRFRPLATMTRAEAYVVFMKSICIYEETTSRNWQNEVAKTAKDYGFTVRSVNTFEPNKPILRQELYILAARMAEYKTRNGDSCEALPDELICEA